MYENILIPVALDHNHDIDEAMKLAQLLRADGGKITLLSVVETVPGYVAGYLPAGQLDKNRQEIQSNLKADAEGAENIDTKVIVGHPGSAHC